MSNTWTSARPGSSNLLRYLYYNQHNSTNFFNVFSGGYLYLSFVIHLTGKKLIAFCAKYRRFAAFELSVLAALVGTFSRPISTFSGRKGTNGMSQSSTRGGLVLTVTSTRDPVASKVDRTLEMTDRGGTIASLNMKT